jgi:hypothetical protein
MRPSVLRTLSQMTDITLSVFRDVRRGLRTQGPPAWCRSTTFLTVLWVVPHMRAAAR